MKYTDKWIVVPYSSLNKKINKNSMISNQIFSNKTLTNDEKLAAYNNYIIRKFRKRPSNTPEEKIKYENQKLDEEDEWIDENSEDEIKNEDISELEEPFNNYFAAPKIERRISAKISQYHKPIRFKIDSDDNDEDEEMDYIQNKSMYNAPAAKNTRSIRKISDESFSQIIDSNKIHRKRKKKIQDSSLKNLKSDTGIIKKWNLITKNKKINLKKN
jgi:hypothetical protein